MKAAEYAMKCMLCPDLQYFGKYSYLYYSNFR